MLRFFGSVLFAFCAFAPFCRGAEANVEADVIIYGGTPGGIAAALSAGREGRTVRLIEPYSFVGGLTTNGLSHPDFRTFEALTGTYLELTRRVEAYYVEKYGPDSSQVKDCLQGTHGEPHVNRRVFELMLGEISSIEVFPRHRLVAVEKSSVDDRMIAAIEVESADGMRHRFGGRIFIDATYEGDLLAAAGVSYRIGREGRDEYGESLAPPSADEQVQGYNFRLIVTQDPKLRVMPEAPSGYRREQFVPILKLIDAGKIREVFCVGSCSGEGPVVKAHLPLLPNGKYDVNDVSRGLARLSLPDLNNRWPDGSLRTREEIYGVHVRHNIGLIYFLQNDPAVPKQMQDAARQWGWCRDEFVGNGHLPEQLYVREARRMAGRYVFTEKDTDHAGDDARAVLHTDAIAMGDYGPNCHGTDHAGPRFGSPHTGEFYKRVSPYQIPYGVILPKECDNLLVPVACSSSHVGFCALRLEPIWSSLGQAAGVAAHLAIDAEVPLGDVSPSLIQQSLHRAGAATIYLSDVPNTSPDFAAAQWWGVNGGWHGLAPRPAQAGERGRHRLGQYYHAFPNHAAELERLLDDDIKERWLTLARQRFGINGDSLETAKTRREFIQSAFTMVEN